MKPKAKTVGYGYVGVWHDGELGWFLPLHVAAPYSRGRKDASPPPKHPEWSNIGEPSYLCKITIELVRDCKGRHRMQTVKP